VTASWQPAPGAQPVRSNTLAVAVRDRADADVAREAAALGSRLQAEAEKVGEWGDRGNVDDLAWRLGFLGDAHAVPWLLDAMYRLRRAYVEATILAYYVPEQQRTRRAMLGEARRRGLAPDMQWALEVLGATPAEMRAAIARSLAPDNRPAWPQGALAAQIHGDDAFTARLVALATDPQSGAQDQAISALALNRTDAGVAALRKLRLGPRPAWTEQCIRTAYVARGAAEGRPLRKDDFPEALQHDEAN
jgi:hypothetical protein